MFLRNKLFEWNIISSEKFKIPVIVVGNLSMGGAGKTPQVEYLVRLFKNKNIKPAVLSRGYRRKTKGFIKANKNATCETVGDEPLQFKKKFENIEVAVDEKRTRGIKILNNTNPDLDVIILDDAYQHRYVKPGLSILLTDYHNLYRNDYIFPTGTLREFRCGAKRADIIIVSKIPPVFSPLTRRYLNDTIKLRKNQKLFYSYISYNNPVIVPGITVKQPCKKYDSILMFSGVANSYPLQEHLKTMCSELVVLEFNDHHKYSEKDINKIIKTFDDIFSTNKIIITTEKDAMRLIKTNLINYMKEYPVYYIPMEVKFHSSKESFDKLVIDYVEKNKRNRSISSETKQD